MMKREVYLDTICGVMIINIILAHICAYSGCADILDHILFFALPWFFFKAGMFFHVKDNLWQQLSRDARRLLLPFISFGLLGVVFTLSLAVIGNGYPLPSLREHVKTLLLFGTFPSSYHLWFLFTLFLVKTTANVLWKKWSVYIIILLCIGLTSLSYFTIHPYPLYVFNALDALVFFGMGFIMKEAQYKPKMVVASIVVLVGILCVAPTKLDMMKNQVLYGFYPLWYPFSLAGIICMNAFARWLYTSFSLPSFLRPLIGIVDEIGKHSLLYYVSQGILLKIGRLLCSYCGIDNPAVKVVIYIGVCIVAYPLLATLFRRSPRLRFMIGE